MILLELVLGLMFGTFAVIVVGYVGYQCLRRRPPKRMGVCGG